MSSLARRFPSIKIIGEEGDSLHDEPFNATTDDKINEEVLKLKCPENLKDVEENQVLKLKK